jgi:pimeloyl-ACP methyl ester carboxylesterase
MAGDIHTLVREHVKVADPIVLVGHDIHQARDIAEFLVQGRERAYLQYMIGVRIFDPSAISPADFETYVRAYETPGAMRAAFELYRAFEEDKTAVRKAITEGGKLRMPTLSIGGSTSGLGEWMPKMLDELAEGGQHAIAPRSGHWIPEENPGFLAEALIRFVEV